jgi:hypothetical protein
LTPFFSALRYHLTDRGCYFDLLNRTNFIGAPGGIGLDQVNVHLPLGLGNVGDVSVTMTVDGQNSNMVTLKFGESQSILVTEALEE